MHTMVTWKDGMEFVGTVDNYLVPMDAKAPIGKDKAPNPKELVVIGLGGCTAMDVIALLKKYNQLPRTFRVDADVEPTTGSYPVIFKSALLRFVVEGEVDAQKLLEAVKLSQTKYCGVSAMLSKAIPINYKVILNGKEIGQGSANFENTGKENG